MVVPSIVRWHPPSDYDNVPCGWWQSSYHWMMVLRSQELDDVCPLPLLNDVNPSLSLDNGTPLIVWWWYPSIVGWWYPPLLNDGTSPLLNDVTPPLLDDGTILLLDNASRSIAGWWYHSTAGWCFPPVLNGGIPPFLDAGTPLITRWWDSFYCWMILPLHFWKMVPPPLLNDCTIPLLNAVTILFLDDHALSNAGWWYILRW